MARIYIGRTTGIGSFERHVVLKMILPERANDEVSVQMFLDEARLSASLNHQNVAQVFEVGEDAGMHFLAMEYVHGQDLRALLARAGSVGTRVPLELALTLVSGAAAGLHHAHERRNSDGTPMGIVHRDVSPSNIMIGYEGSIKLLDFGIAKATSRSIETQQGVIKGKFAYMSPEQCRGRDVDARSDVFSLGIILYEVTTQHRCFRADSDFDTMHRIVTGDVVRPTRLVQGYPQALETIVMKALAVDVSQRYQSAGQLLEALEGFAAAGRVSLSTMALGRFMRELFGEVLEPWLTAARPSQPGLSAKEQTVSNTHDTGGRQRQSSSSPAAPMRPSSPSSPARSSPLVRTPAASSPGIRPPSSPPLRHEDAPLHLPAESAVPAAQDSPSGAQTQIALEVETRVTRDDALDSGRRPKAPPPPLSSERAAASPPAGRVSSPNLMATATPPPAAAWPNGSQPIPPPLAGVNTGTGTPLFSANTGSGSGRVFSAKPGSGTGPSALRSNAASINTGYPSPATRSDPSRPRYEPAPVLPQAVAQPAVSSSRRVYVGVGVALIAIIVLLVISILEGPDESPTTAATDGPVVKMDVKTTEIRTPDPSTTAAAGSAAQAGSGATAAIADPSIRIQVRSTPAGADVSLGDTPVGKTPLDIHVGRTTSFATLTVHRAGYVDATVRIDLSKDYLSDIKLAAIPPEPRTTPARDQKPPPARDQRPPPRAIKRPPPPSPAPPASKTTKCQPQERYNPYDTSCNGKPCPSCPMVAPR